MTDDSAPPSGLTLAIRDAVLAAAKHDAEGLRGAIMRVAEVDFPAGVAFACYGWARIAAASTVGGADALDEYIASGASAGVQFMDRTTNGIVNAEDADPVTRFVGRMIACAFNDDHHAALDLWATTDEDIWVECSVAMAQAAGAGVLSMAKNGQFHRLT